MILEIVQISLKDKTDTIQSLHKAIKRQIQAQCPLNTFIPLFLSEKKALFELWRVYQRCCNEFSSKYISLLDLSSGKGILFTPGLYQVLTDFLLIALLSLPCNKGDILLPDKEIVLNLVKDWD